MREDLVAGVLAAGLGKAPRAGGSAADGAPAAIPGCDGMLRRIEAEPQLAGPISARLAHHRVRGLCTSAEQIGAMQVKQTLTGVALYPPGTP